MLVQRGIWIIGIESIKSEILSRANVNVNKGDDVQYRTRPSGRLKENRKSSSLRQTANLSKYVDSMCNTAK